MLGMQIKWLVISEIFSWFSKFKNFEKKFVLSLTELFKGG